jgi:hypothetical protein
MTCIVPRVACCRFAGLWNDPAALQSLLNTLKEAAAFAAAPASASSAGASAAAGAGGGGGAAAPSGAGRALRLASGLMQFGEGRPGAPALQRAVAEVATAVRVAAA